MSFAGGDGQLDFLEKVGNAMGLAREAYPMTFEAFTLNLVCGSVSSFPDDRYKRSSRTLPMLRQEKC
jgi:hypothetical protein